MSDHICPWWLAWTFDNPLRRLIHPAARILEPYVQEGDTVADIGAGMGYFSLTLAHLVGPSGRVLAVDLQSTMLERAQRRAIRQGVADRIHFLQCTPTSLGIGAPVDFVLAFWMVHEVADQDGMFIQVAAAMKPTAVCLVVEPRGHVPGTAFDRCLKTAAAAGLIVQSRPKIGLSRAALLQWR
jgi:ubiquinone/menaquinone biosynthesis C-methylase UbiE